MRLTERLDHRFHEASARGGACRNWTMVSSGDHLIWCLHLRSRVTERHRLEAPRSEANDTSRRLSHVISPSVLIERDKIDNSSLVRYRAPPIFLAASPDDPGRFYRDRLNGLRVSWLILRRHRLANRRGCFTFSRNQSPSSPFPFVPFVSALTLDLVIERLCQISISERTSRLQLSAAGSRCTRSSLAEGNRLRNSLTSCFISSIWSSDSPLSLSFSPSSLSHRLSFSRHEGATDEELDGRRATRLPWLRFSRTEGSRV